MPCLIGADACVNLRRTEGLHERGSSIGVHRLGSRGIMGQWFMPSALKCHETGAILCNRTWLGTYRRIEGVELDLQSERRGPGGMSLVSLVSCASVTRCSVAKLTYATRSWIML
jgi:hypothetical protein